MKTCKTLKSPIKSFGGKSGMQNKLYELFPKDYEVMIEPFMGSMIMTLNNPVEKCTEIVNDLNLNIYTLFKVIQNPEAFEKLKQKLDLTCYHEVLFKDSQNALNYNLSEVDRAYHFFILNRQSYSGNNASFGKNYCIRRNMSKSTSDFLSTIDGLDIIHRRISQMIILNRDGIKLIDENRMYDNTFIYCDPPYHHSTRTSTRYPVDMSNEQQEELLHVLTKPDVKSKILLSGYNCELYERVLVQKNGWVNYSFDVHTVSGSNKPKTKIETLWKNY